MSDIAITVILVLLVLALIATVYALDQRSKRRDAEDDLALARLRGKLVDGETPFPSHQTPFPFGTRLP